MVDISSQNNKINVTVSSSGNTANTNVTPDYAQYYSEKSKEWATSNRIVDNTDYSSKYYANESKKQADISTAKTAEVVESGNIAVSNIESARDNAIVDVNTAGATQVALATEQATIATNKTSEVVTSGNTALSNITTAKNNAITSITTQENTSKNNVIATGNAQVERVNLTGVYNRTPIFTKSEVGTNKSVYKNVYDLKHSTFDKSKFTVVGNPTITDDGIASGFSGTYSTEYIKSYKTINTTNAVNMRIKYSFTIMKAFTKGQTFLLNYGNSAINGKPNVQLYGTLSAIQGSINSNASKYTSWEVGDNFKVVYDLQTNKPSTYTLFKNDVKVIETSGSYTDWKQNAPLYLYGNYNGDGEVSVDLPQFSISVDGKEVFSGNKTGLDVIKPDNYTVVGSPNITEDGVASGFRTSNYLTIPKEIINSLIGHKWRIDYKFITKPNADATSHRYLLGTKYDTNTTNPITLGLFNQNYYWFAKLLLSDGSRTASFYNALNNTNFGSMIGYLEFDGNNYINAVLQETDTSWKITRVASNLSIAEATEDLKIGYGLTSGSIDLNAFKIYIDGNLVYQPCLKIPYTQSKTGSKIVDVAYRDRVIDLYEQEGQAGYYTIDEPNKNFTLPMGEIYGMIEQKADKLTVKESLATKADVTTPSIQAPYIKDTYVNGTSGYIIWSNGYCEQWGRCGKQTVSLLKTFRDTNYTLLLTAGDGTGSSTDWANPITTGAIKTNSFITASPSGYVNPNVHWKASGYIK